MLQFLLQSRPGVCEPGAFWMKREQQMLSRHKPHALQLAMRLQSTGQTKSSVSCLPFLESVQPRVPPWSGRSVCSSSTFLSAFKLPNRGGFSLRTHWGWTQILLRFHAASFLPGTWGFGSGSQKCPDESTVHGYSLLSYYNHLILPGSESKNMENCRGNKTVPSSSFMVQL